MKLKKFLFIIFSHLFLYISSGYAQNLNSDFVPDSLYNKSFNSYKSGEFFEYKLHYGFFNTSYASLEIKEENLDTEEAPLELSEEAPAEENKPE